MARRPVILFQWKQTTPYLLDRVEAVRNAGITDLDVLWVADSPSSDEWPFRASSSSRVIFHLLYQDRKFEQTRPLGRLLRRLALLRRYKIKHAFLCHHDHLDTLVAASILRLLGTRVYLMLESKFDDKDRRAWREVLKWFFVRPYEGALLGGRRHKEYAEFLGLASDKLIEGYDTVSIDRVRQQAGMPPAPDGVPFRDRHFTIVARHVAKKNLFMALEAYDLYARASRAAGEEPRELHLCGAGELEAALKEEAQKRDLAKVRFLGFISPDAVARELGSSLALILASKEEQWGLVINEALAMGLPVLCAENVGARDALLRTAVNGYLFESDNPVGLSVLMGRLASDEQEWRRMAVASSGLAIKGDVSQFAAGVAKLIGAEAASSVGLRLPLEGGMSPSGNPN
jgi:L-malate glycosyltransferase